MRSNLQFRKPKYVYGHHGNTNGTSLRYALFLALFGVVFVALSATFGYSSHAITNGGGGSMQLTMTPITAASSIQSSLRSISGLAENGLHPCGQSYHQDPAALALPKNFAFPTSTESVFSKWQNYILSTKVGKERGLDAVGKEDRQYLFHAVQQTCQHAIESYGSCKTLELGFALGGSAMPILEGHYHAKKSARSVVKAFKRSIHYAVDPYQFRNYGDVGTKSVAQYMTDHPDNSVDFFLIRDLSQVALAYFTTEGSCFDVIFIDAGHRYDEIMVDLTYAVQLASVGGVIILHDTWMGATQAARSWVKTNLKGILQEVEHGMTDDLSSLAFVKIGHDERSHNHFEPFKTDYKNIRDSLTTSTSFTS